MPKYQVVTHAGNPKDRLMRATAAIKRGEEIMSEEALASLDFLHPAAAHSGVKAMPKLRNSLSPEVRNQLAALPNNDPGRGTEGLIETNAFEEDDQRGALKYKVLRIYDEMSRFKHSCQPNAELHWDSARNRGSLHAVRPIAVGDEIFINYLADAQSSLHTRTPRRTEIQKQWGFVCSCEVCILQGIDLNNNNAARINARVRYQELNKPRTESASWRVMNNQTTSRLQKATEYIGFLQQLDIEDGRLAWAYDMLAYLQYHMWRTAESSIRETNRHCASCNINRGSVWHLRRSLDARRDLYRIDRRIYPKSHPRLAEDSAEINKLIDKIDRS
ncbi:SET domain-containing protein 5 [Vermiconidia calcicola]|uniref:SET domain-containing protein 5 n=1 Tax=Vermiconidia calcicola TaxID=1690605 RepID=A0ACC3MC32_9PEZI|nr:SET domain-containing protein 5 [Vermiconidia calcicola]